MAAKLTGMPPSVSDVGPLAVISASTGVSRAKSTKRRNGPDWAFVGDSAFAEEIPQPRRSDKPMKVDLASLRHGNAVRDCGEGLNSLSRVPQKIRGGSAAGRVILLQYG
jgi:hypothetical protein